MKIITIVGSLREKSINKSIALNLKELMPKNTHYEVLTLLDIPMYNQDMANVPDPVQSLASKIQSADAIIFSSPEYNYSIPGCLKNAIDWISRLPDQPLAGKTAGIIGASPGAVGTARMQYDLRKVGVFLDINFINKPEVMINFANTKIDENGHITDEKTKEFLQKFVETLCKKAS